MSEHNNVMESGAIPVDEKKKKKSSKDVNKEKKKKLRSTKQESEIDEGKGENPVVALSSTASDLAKSTKNVKSCSKEGQEGVLMKNDSAHGKRKKKCKKELELSKEDSRHTTNNVTISEPKPLKRKKSKVVESETITEMETSSHVVEHDKTDEKEPGQKGIPKAAMKKQKSKSKLSISQHDPAKKEKKRKNKVDSATSEDRPEKKEIEMSVEVQEIRKEPLPIETGNLENSPGKDGKAKVKKKMKKSKEGAEDDEMEEVKKLKSIANNDVLEKGLEHEKGSGHKKGSSHDKKGKKKKHKKEVSIPTTKTETTSAIANSSSSQQLVVATETNDSEASSPNFVHGKVPTDVAPVEVEESKSDGNWIAAVEPKEAFQKKSGKEESTTVVAEVKEESSQGDDEMNKVNEEKDGVAAVSGTVLVANIMEIFHKTKITRKKMPKKEASRNEELPSILKPTSSEPQQDIRATEAIENESSPPKALAELVPSGIQAVQSATDTECPVSKGEAIEVAESMETFKESSSIEDGKAEVAGVKEERSPDCDKVDEDKHVVVEVSAAAATETIDETVRSSKCNNGKVNPMKKSSAAITMLKGALAMFGIASSETRQPPIGAAEIEASSTKTLAENDSTAVSPLQAEESKSETETSSLHGESAAVGESEEASKVQSSIMVVELDVAEAKAEPSADDDACMVAVPEAVPSAKAVETFYDTNGLSPEKGKKTTRKKRFSTESTEEEGALAIPEATSSESQQATGVTIDNKVWTLKLVAEEIPTEVPEPLVSQGESISDVECKESFKKSSEVTEEPTPDVDELNKTIKEKHFVVEASETVAAAGAVVQIEETNGTPQDNKGKKNTKNEAAAAATKTGGASAKGDHPPQPIGALKTGEANASSPKLCRRTEVSQLHSEESSKDVERPTSQGESIADVESKEAFKQSSNKEEQRTRPVEGGKDDYGVNEVIRKDVVAAVLKAVPAANTIESVYETTGSAEDDRDKKKKSEKKSLTTEGSPAILDTISLVPQQASETAEMNESLALTPDSAADEIPNGESKTDAAPSVTQVELSKEEGKTGVAELKLDPTLQANKNEESDVIGSCSSVQHQSVPAANTYESIKNTDGSSQNKMNKNRLRHKEASAKTEGALAMLETTSSEPQQPIEAAETVEALSSPSRVAEEGATEMHLEHAEESKTDVDRPVSQGESNVEDSEAIEKPSPNDGELNEVNEQKNGVLSVSEVSPTAIIIESIDETNVPSVGPIQEESLSLDESREVRSSITEKETDVGPSTRDSQKIKSRTNARAETGQIEQHEASSNLSKALTPGTDPESGSKKVDNKFDESPPAPESEEKEDVASIAEPIPAGDVEEKLPLESLLCSSTSTDVNLVVDNKSEESAQRKVVRASIEVSQLNKSSEAGPEAVKEADIADSTSFLHELKTGDSNAREDNENEVAEPEQSPEEKESRVHKPVESTQIEQEVESGEPKKSSGIKLHMKEDTRKPGVEPEQSLDGKRPKLAESIRNVFKETNTAAEPVHSDKDLKKCFVDSNADHTQGIMVTETRASSSQGASTIDLEGRCTSRKEEFEPIFRSNTIAQDESVNVMVEEQKERRASESATENKMESQVHPKEDSTDATQDADGQVADAENESIFPAVSKSDPKIEEQPNLTKDIQTEKMTYSEAASLRDLGKEADEENEPPPPSMSYIPADIAKELETLRRQLHEASKEKAVLEERLNQREDELKASQQHIEALESEVERQLEDCDLMVNKIVHADAQIKSMMEEAMQLDGLHDKLAELEKYKAELECLKQSTRNGFETDGKMEAASESDKEELQKKLDEKDEVISFLRKELDRHKKGETVPAKLDFSSLNTSLSRFTDEIFMAKSELKAAQEKIGMME